MEYAPGQMKKCCMPAARDLNLLLIVELATIIRSVAAGRVQILEFIVNPPVATSAPLPWGAKSHSTKDSY